MGKAEKMEELKRLTDEIRESGGGKKGLDLAKQIQKIVRELPE